MARIRIDDLPAENVLAEAELEEIHGAGRFRPSIEELETREVMTASAMSTLTASLSGGILKIQDQNPGDIIHVRELNNQISIDGISSITGAGGATVAVSAVSQIQIQALGNSDAIDLSGLLQAQQTLPGVQMNFGAGNDTLTLPSSLSSTPLTIPGDNMTLGGHTLSNVMLTFNNNNLTVQGSATLPLVGNVTLVGNVEMSGSASASSPTYSLSAPLSGLKVGGFTLNNEVVTLSNSGVGLSGSYDLPLLGQQTLNGNIASDGTYVATLTKSESLLGGMVQFSTTTLTFSGDTVTVKASATVADGIGQATFAGSIGADGSYGLTASFNVAIAGFTLPDEGGTLTLGNTPAANNAGASGTSLGVSFSMDVPGMEDENGDPVEASFSGSYGPGGQWSLSGTYPGPVQAGPVTLTDLAFTLNNTSLTLGATVSVADLTEIVDAHASVTFYSGKELGEINMTVTPKVLSLGNYSLASGQVVVTNANQDRDWTMTINAGVNIPGMTSPLTLSGLVDAQGNYTLTGKNDVTVDGVTLLQGNFTLKKGQGITFTETFSYYGFTFDVNGGVGSSGQVQFQGGAVAGGNGFQLANGKVNVDLDPTTDIYSITLSGDVNLPIASLQFNATVGRNAQGVWSQPTLQCTTAITGPLASILPGSAVFTLTPTEVTFRGTVAGDTVQGTVLPDGTVTISGFTGTVGPLGNWVDQQVADLTQKLGSLTGDLVTEMNNGLAAALANKQTQLNNILVAANNGITSDLTWKSSQLQGILTQANNGLSNALNQKNDQIQNFANQANNAIAGLDNSLNSSINSAWATMNNQIGRANSAIQSLQSWLNGEYSRLDKWYNNAVNSLPSWARGLARYLNPITDSFNQAINSDISQFDSAVSSLQQSISSWQNWYSNTVNSLRSQCQSAVSSWQNWFRNEEAWAISQYNQAVQSWQVWYTSKLSWVTSQYNQAVQSWRDWYSNQQSAILNQYDQTVNNWHSWYNRTLQSAWAETLEQLYQPQLQDGLQSQALQELEQVTGLAKSSDSTSQQLQQVLQSVASAVCSEVVEQVAARLNPSSSH